MNRLRRRRIGRTTDMKAVLILETIWCTPHAKNGEDNSASNRCDSGDDEKELEQERHARIRDGARAVGILYTSKCHPPGRHPK